MEKSGQRSGNSGKHKINQSHRMFHLHSDLLSFRFHICQLNDVYSKAERLKKWYKKIRIDSFSQGSVLVDYFVELADVSRDINTQEIKQMFHSALTEVPMTVVPLKNNASAASNMEPFASEYNDNVKPSRSNYLMGDFILDPLATDFIGKN